MTSVLHYNNIVAASEQSQITEIKSDDELEIEVMNQEDKMHWLHKSSTLKKQILDEKLATA